MRDTRRIQIESIQIGPAPGSDQYMRAGNRFRSIIALYFNGNASVQADTPDTLISSLTEMPSRCNCAVDVGGFEIFLRKNTEHLKDCGLCAKAPMCLRQFAPDGAATNYQQVPGHSVFRRLSRS